MKIRINIPALIVAWFGFLAILFLVPLQTFSQGVPKAYEAETYHSKLNGQSVTFILANGYIAASSVKLFIPSHKKPVVFQADNAVEDENNRLKFVTYLPGRHDYFVMDNMQPAYDDVPAYIAGKYYSDNKVIPVKFWLVKYRKC
jgi:hypothetical protein